jgi:hypothetical protein
MTLDRKDVRLKLDAEIHAQLVCVADVDALDIGTWVESLVVAELTRRVHEARLIAERFPRLPNSGSDRE